ncbi:MAG: TerB family tellurite resistance protein [Gammaproteobacteria bacterium]|nr:TerB family tellurite resistance protein [Gammaproteobacteria bacterium]
MKCRCKIDNQGVSEIMLDMIKQFFQESMSTEAKVGDEHRLQLATAALMIEMMRQDDEIHEAEERAVKAAIGAKFSLSEDETHTLFELAHAEARNANDYYQFTRLINENFSQQQKFTVIKYLWEIAYADNHLDRYEEHMVRRIAELIYVSHSDFMRAKHMVLESL